LHAGSYFTDAIASSGWLARSETVDNDAVMKRPPRPSNFDYLDSEAPRTKRIIEAALSVNVPWHPYQRRCFSRQRSRSLRSASIAERGSGYLSILDDQAVSPDKKSKAGDDVKSAGSNRIVVTFFLSMIWGLP
jgi:hypothetical protein